MAQVSVAGDAQVSVPDLNWTQNPHRADFTCVAGDSFLITLALTLPGHMVDSRSLHLMAHIRSTPDTVDGYFVDGSGSASHPVDPPEGFPIKDKYRQRHPGDVTLRAPYMYSRNPRNPFSREFGWGFGDNRMANYIPVDRSSQTIRTYLLLTPMMTRLLFDAREDYMSPTDEDEEFDRLRYRCYHLPYDANVPPTASGYPDKPTGPSWTGAVGLPVLGTEYDDRKDERNLFTWAAEKYRGIWDLQLVSGDGRFTRTLVSGLATVTADATRQETGKRIP